MPRTYDNWERLVAAVIKREELWQLFHDHSRTPSVLSEASSDFSSSSFHLSNPLQTPGSLSKTQRDLPKLVLISDFSPAFDVKDVYLDSAKLLGRGTFGVTYAVAMDNGIRMAVKRLTPVSISESDFKRQMDVLGNIRHENVAALRAYYSSGGERLMLYDYYRKGGVYELLHGQSGTYLDWGTRLKIAIGAARGIAEVHSQIGGTLVHGNVKSSNIFLNSQHYGCVADLGLTSMIQTKFMPTARCYAPEVTSTLNVTQESDVYSFGILLLELLTRKSTTNARGGPQAVNMVKLVNSVKDRETIAKVFDADLLKHPAIRDDMVEMFQIGIRCIVKSIKKRPKMSEVVKMLQDISMLNLTSLVSLEGKLVFVGDGYPRFDIEDMLGADAEVIGRGTFGTCYKVLLENGNTIAVKRLKHVNVTFEEFQQHIEAIGRMRHQNVDELRAYYFSKDKNLLVYDYYRTYTLSAILHGNILNWDNRLRIAVGVARAIVHIHRQDGRKLVHGNINSSNIFIYGHKYGILSDAGVSKVVRSVECSRMQNPGYCAPEVTDTNKVSQASDVYSFGVMLLELVTGRAPQHTTDDGEVVSLVDWIQYVLLAGQIQSGFLAEWNQSILLAKRIQSVLGSKEIPEVVDVELVRHLNDNEKAKVQQSLQIGMDCVDVVPEQRPRMSRVVKMLEDISDIEPSNESRFEDPWEDTTTFESRMENILEDLLPTIRQ